MWNDDKSVALSKVFVVLFMALLAACVIFVPFLVDNTINYRVDGIVTGEPAAAGIAEALATLPKALFRITIYTGAVPAGAILVLLYVLLGRISKGEVFIAKNTNNLRYISWCCFIGAVISLASAFYWLPWSAVGVAAAFMGLIVRIVKNVFAKAVSLQDDADLTV